MVTRKLRPQKPAVGTTTNVEPGVCHRRGWMRIGPMVTVWCTCGWKFHGTAKESDVQILWDQHLT